MITTRALSANDAAALTALFEACDCPCYCRYFHFEGDKNDWLARCAEKPTPNRAELISDLAQASPRAQGVIALVDDRVVGWLKTSPPFSARKAYEQRVYRSLPQLAGHRPGVWHLSCTLIHPDFRRRGVATLLVGAAVEAAAAWGAREIEAFPRRVSEPVNDAELFAIPEGALLAHGFVHACGEPPYPVLRRTLGGEP